MSLFPDWLIKHLLPKTGIALLSGQSRVGKTFLAIHLAGTVATGGLFFGRQVKEPVGVLIIAGEASGTMAPRLEALRQRVLEGIDSGSLPIAWAEAHDATAIRQAIDDGRTAFPVRFGVRLGLVVIDTIAAVFNVEDENDAHTATTTMKTLQSLSSEFDCLVLGVTHFGKHAESGVRGSSAWTASADVVLAATANINEATGEVKDRRLSLSKSRDAEAGPISGFEFEIVVISLDADGDAISIPVIRPCAVKAKERKSSPRVPLLLECVAKVLATEPSEIDGQPMAPRERVRTSFGRHFGDSGNATRAFKGAIASAEAIGLLKIEAMGGRDYFAPAPADG